MKQYEKPIVEYIEFNIVAELANGLPEVGGGAVDASGEWEEEV